MAYTLEFEIAGDNNGSGHTGTATFSIVVNGVTTNLGTATTPVDTAPGYQWGFRTKDVTAQFDPSADVQVRWNYSSGSDAVNIRNLRITDGTDEWLDQWGRQGDPWNAAYPWASDGSGAPNYFDWYGFGGGAAPGSVGNYYGTAQVHHVIKAPGAGTHVLRFDLSAATTLSQKTRINAFFNGVDVEDVHSITGISSGLNFGRREVDVSDLWVGDGTDQFAWRYYATTSPAPWGAGAHVRNVEVVDGSGTLIEADQYYPLHHGPSVNSAGMAGQSGGVRNSAQADVCTYVMPPISAAAAGWVYHDFPGVRCPPSTLRRPVVGYIGFR